jgi:ribosome-binding protein aMBF1 (putative translation factor)
MQDHRTRPSPGQTSPAAADQGSPGTRVKSEFHRALGLVVRYTRARRALSQEELGDRSELHRNYVGAIERGEINPTFRVLLKLARGLGLPLSELIREQERIVQPPRE